MTPFSHKIEAVYSKNKRTLIQPFNSKVRKLLLEAKLKSGDSEFVYPKAMAIKGTSISNKFRSLCKKLGIKDLRFHDIRHTAGTRLGELGIDVSTISKILGHANMNMSMRYIHPNQSIRNALEELANFESTATNIATTDTSDLSN